MVSYIALVNMLSQLSSANTDNLRGHGKLGEKKVDTMLMSHSRTPQSAGSGWCNSECLIYRADRRVFEPDTVPHFSLFSPCFSHLVNDNLYQLCSVHELFMNIHVSSLLIHKHIWRASVASETVLGVDNAKSGICYWRASVASETVLGVDNAKSGICFMYICMWDGTYAL